MNIFKTLTFLIAIFHVACAVPALTANHARKVSQALFDSLEELARIVDVSYCVGSTGVQKPFQCLSRCSDFEGFELVIVCVISETKRVVLTEP